MGLTLIGADEVTIIPAPGWDEPWREAHISVPTRLTPGTDASPRQGNCQCEPCCHARRLRSWCRRWYQRRTGQVPDIQFLPTNLIEGVALADALGWPDPLALVTLGGRHLQEFLDRQARVHEILGVPTPGNPGIDGFEERVMAAYPPREVEIEPAPAEVEEPAEVEPAATNSTYVALADEAEAIFRKVFYWHEGRGYTWEEVEEEMLTWNALYRGAKSTADSAQVPVH